MASFTVSGNNLSLVGVDGSSIEFDYTNEHGDLLLRRIIANIDHAVELNEYDRIIGLIYDSATKILKAHTIIIVGGLTYTSINYIDLFDVVDGGMLAYLL